MNRVNFNCFFDAERFVNKVKIDKLSVNRFNRPNYSISCHIIGKGPTVFTLNMKKIVPMIDCSPSITRFVT